MDSPFGSFDAGAVLTVRPAPGDVACEPALCRPWSASTVRVLNAAGVVAASPYAQDHWVAAPRMDALVQSWAAPLQDAGHLHTDAQVVRMETDRLRPGAWQLTTVSRMARAMCTQDSTPCCWPCLRYPHKLCWPKPPARWPKALRALPWPLLDLMLGYPRPWQPPASARNGMPRAAHTTALPGWRESSNRGAA
jgi:hypothetical protein